MFYPITTDKAFSPDNLRKVITCKCKTKSKNQCGTNSCTCRKHGIHCMSTCGDCRGKESFNAAQYIISAPHNEDNDEYGEDIVERLMEVL